MKLDDLREVLDDHADDVRPPRLAPHVEIRARVRRRTQLRTVGAVAATVVAVAAAALVVPNLTTAGRQATPASTTSPSPLEPSTKRTPTPDPVNTTVFGVFPSHIDGAPLLRTFVVPRGTSTGSFTVDAPSAGVGYSVQCVVPGVASPRGTDVALRIRANGVPKVDVGCGTELSGTTYVTSKDRSAGGSKTIQLQLILAGKQISRPQARIAVGVYSGDYPTRTKNGFTVPEIKGSPPNAGTLHSFDTLTLTPGHRKLTVRVPASTEPIQISYTSSGAVAAGTVTLTVPGEDEPSTGGGGVGTVTVPAGPARTVSLAADDPQSRATGKLAIAVYLAK